MMEEYEQHEYGSPPKTAQRGAADVVDEWALLNELDITSYQLEQEKRRIIESDQKMKVKMDLMNQMREKSQSQALVRSMDEEEWRKQKQRLDEWNDQERVKNEKRIRRMEKRREMLLKQMQEAQERAKQQKRADIDEGRRVAAQIREDMHAERERMMRERAEATEEFHLQCEENEMLQMLKQKETQAAENRTLSDLDRYFTKKEQEEADRQAEIANKYNNCRLRETRHANKVAELDKLNTHTKKTDAELDVEMMQASSQFDEKEVKARKEKEDRKKESLALLDRQVEEKAHRRRMEFNEALQTVGDMRDAVQEHEEEERRGRIKKYMDTKVYGELLMQQKKEMDKDKLAFVIGMTPVERRINLPLLEKLRETAAPALLSRPNTGSVAPFSERGSRPQTGVPAKNPVGSQFAKAKKIMAKMKGTTVQFG